MIRRCSPWSRCWPLLLAGCGEKEDRAEPVGLEAASSCMLDFFPNADHAGIYAAQAAGALQAGRARREHPPAPDPAAPAQAGGGRDGGPGDLLRARGAARPRPGARRGGRGRAGPGAADLDHLPAQGEDPHARPTSRARRSAPRGSTTRPPSCARSARGRREPRDVKERNVGFGLQPALLTGKVDATLGGFWNYEGVDLRSRSAAADHPRRPRPACPPTTSWCWWPTRTPSSATAAASARSSARWPAAPATCSATRTTASSGLLEANPDLDPRLQRASLKVTLPLFSPPRGQALRLPGPRPVERVRGLDEREQAAAQHRRRPRRVHQRATPRRRALAARPGPATGS